jgi:hypothetical protein
MFNSDHVDDGEQLAAPRVGPPFADGAKLSGLAVKVPFEKVGRRIKPA